MTMIAFAAHRDRADILTDSLTYTHTATRMGHTSKVRLLPHLDGAVLAQGSTGFELRWHSEALHLAQRTADFDDFAREMPRLLAEVWDDMAAFTAAENARHGRAATVANSIAFLIGYSPEQRGFKAYGWASDDAFKPVDLAGLYVMPSPLDRRPSDFELRRLSAHLPAIDPQGALVVDALARRPVQAPPRQPSAWVDLAKAVRRDRALVDLYSGLKTYVGGDVFHTVLRRGEASSRRVHRFDDAGAEFTRMMAGSLHPVSQAGPCDCGSGRRFVDCCLAAIADEPCPCQSTMAFERCCSVNAERAARGRLVG